MDPTALPTDNLYKFMALAGLGLTFAAGWVFWRQVDRWHRRLDRAHRRVARHSAKGAKLNALLRKAAALAATGKLSDEVEAKRLAREASELEHVLEHDSELLHVTADANLAEFEQHSVPRPLIAIALVTGAVLTGMGFKLWYYRLQQVQDKVTQDAAREQRARADLAELELTKAKTRP